MSIFLYLLTVALWHKTWSILEKDPCAAEKKVYSFFAGWYILYKSVKSKLLIVLLRSMVSLFNFYLEDLSNGERGVLKLPSIILLWSI